MYSVSSTLRKVDSKDEYSAPCYASNQVFKDEKLGSDCLDHDEPLKEQCHVLLRAVKRSRESGQAYSCVHDDRNMGGSVDDSNSSSEERRRNDNARHDFPSAFVADYVVTEIMDTPSEHELHYNNSSHSSLDDRSPLEIQSAPLSGFSPITSPSHDDDYDCRLGDLNPNFSDFYYSAASYSSPQTCWCSTDGSSSIPDSTSPPRSFDSHETKGLAHFFRSSRSKEHLCHPSQVHVSLTSQEGTQNTHILIESGPKETLDSGALCHVEVACLKRRRSLVAAAKSTDDCAKMGTGFLPTTLPPRKKQRLGRFGILRSSQSLVPSMPKQNFSVKRPASLRRAQSLRSDIESSSTHHSKEKCAPIVCLGSVSQSARQLESESPLVATVPTTPIAITSGRSHALHCRLALSYSGASFLSPVPIIAPPPPNLIPIPPDSEESRAKLRLRRFVEREACLRIKQPADEGCTLLYCGKDVLDTVEDIVRVSNTGEGIDHSKNLIDDADDLGLRKSGIDALETREAVEWILTVLPKISTVNFLQPAISDWCKESMEYVSDTESFTDSGSPSLCEFQSCSRTKSGCFDLYDQLVTSPQTRFHAAHLFSRYLARVLGPEDGQPVADSEQHATSDELRDGMTLVKWDVAVGCLALSVKYHRDTLPPLKPVFGSEFLLIAPHVLTYDDLEITQRDILSALSFNLGGTPQAVLDELWLALPDLRKALGYRDGWSIAQNEAWLRLFDAVAQPDVLRYPISHLAAVAITEGIEVSLALKHQAEEHDIRWRQNYAARRKIRGSGPLPEIVVREANPTRTAETPQSRVAIEIGPIVTDIQALLGIHDADFAECRRWLANVTDSLVPDVFGFP